MNDKPRLDLQLRSNVKQCYDYCFSRHADLVFLRMYHTPYLNHIDLMRRDMFAALEKAGIQTVENGLVRDLLKKMDPPHGLVVYTDEKAHRGEGKIWVSNQEALLKYPDHWASVFHMPVGEAIRHFQFGNRCFTMPFQTQDDWRCQKGDTTHSWCVPGSPWAHLFPHVIPYPYFALDFIPGTNLVTDFQFVPGTTDDGLENWMTPREMYRALQEAAFILNENNLITGSVKQGHGFVWLKDLGDEESWIQRIGDHPQGDK